jgi:hypothetical protein
LIIGQCDRCIHDQDMQIAAFLFELVSECGH